MGKNTNRTQLHAKNRYLNRSNLHILKNKIIHERDLMNIKRQKELEYIQTKKKLILKSNDEVNTGWIGDLCTIGAKKRKLERLERLEIDLNQNTQYFNERVSQLKPDHIASLIIFADVTSNCKETFQSESDRCNKCGTLYKLNINNHSNKCEICKLFVRCSSVTEDIQSDYLSFNNQKNPILKKNQPEEIEKRSSNTVIVVKRRDKTNSSDRKVAYKKFLLQFAINAIETPEEIKNLLYENFMFIHVFSSSKCRPSPVANILKLNNQLQYVSFSVRIARELNNEPIPSLKLELIDKLVIRFEEINIAASNVQNFDKLPSFEILTHTFLRAEKLDDLANYFYTHKAANALRSADVKMRELIDECCKIPNVKSDWTCVPRGG